MLFGGQRPRPVRMDADGQVVTGEGKICGLCIVGGAAATQVALYDNTSATGDPICEGAAGINSSSPHISFADFGGIDFSIGLYLDITTTGGAVYIFVI